MRKILFTAFFFGAATILSAQPVVQRLQAAWKQFETDSQLKHAISSLYVVDAKTGKVVFEKNAQVGLAPASTQKIITAATAFELLGKDFSYKTEFGYYGKIEAGFLKGMFYLGGSGDPTLGSNRFKSTTEKVYYDNLLQSIAKAGIKNDSLHPTSLLLDMSRYDEKMQNDNWIWEDLGNYYGAGSIALNWRENQFDAIVIPGAKEGDETKEIKLSPWYLARRMVVNNQTQTGKRGSGDRTSFYINPHGEGGSDYVLDLRGTVPAGVDSFVVSAAHPGPYLYFSEALLPYDEAAGQTIEDSPHYSWFSNKGFYWGGDSATFQGFIGKPTSLYIHSSPPLSEMIYWFLQKSINLYGEAFMKTFAYQKYRFGTTDSGISIVKDFWKKKGIDESELAIGDGSGLSPQNRVTTHAQVEILKYARKQNWFPSFYAALPEYNNMKMKSGTIHGVKGFCGYYKAKDGKEYIFSFLVNNYNGPTSAVVNKMYKLLDLLK